MRKIPYFDTEITVEEYVRKEILKNAGTQNIAMKSDLLDMCDERGLTYDKNISKEGVFDLLIENGCKHEDFANRFGVGVSSQIYQKTFGIAHDEVKRLEKHGVLKVVGQYRYRAFGRYMYAPLYDLYQFVNMEAEDMTALLLQYPKRKRVNKNK